ncbi:glycosyltransferase family 4 protein [Methanobacterium sp.]|uniref:glycosyltransferase family 4 protein n=1 Tax=Methanobacterium sp. TaxID=2164 RepID=UPI003C787386
MKIAVIPPRTNTGEAEYSNYLITGMLKKDLKPKIVQNSFYNRPNVKIFLGSLLLKKMIKGKYIIHNLDNLGPYIIKNNTSSKLVLTIHDIVPIIMPEIHGNNLNNKIMRLNFKFLLPRIIKNTDLIIVPSRSTKNDIITKLKVEEDKIEIVPMGVDKEIFYPKAVDYKLLENYGIKKDYILYVGNDNPRKNLKNLILAYAKIIDKIGHKLVLMGPINKAELIKTIKTCKELEFNKKKLLNNIIFPGFVDKADVPMVYNAATALVFPSLYEGFGLTPLEAMASSVPVIISNNSSLREVVGDAGLYINNPLDPDEIADKIIEVIKNEKLQKKLRKNGLKQSLKFDWEKTVHKTIKAYENII